MSSLPQHVAQSIAAVDTCTLSPDNRECTICHEALRLHEGDEIAAQLACGHAFGRECLTRWLALGATCPMCRAEVYELSPDLKTWRGDRGAMIEHIDEFFEDPANSTTIVLRGMEFVSENTSIYEVPSDMVQCLCWEVSGCLGDLASAGWMEYILFFEDCIQHLIYDAEPGDGKWLNWGGMIEDPAAFRLMRAEVEYARGMVGWAALPGHEQDLAPS